jgi:hypothetical protein
MGVDFLRHGAGRLGALGGALVTAALVAACGGGGGGGGGDGAGSGGAPTPPPVAVDNSFRIALAVTPLSFSAEEGMAVAPATLTGTISGTQPASLYTGGDDLGKAIDHVEVLVDGTQLNVKVYAKSNLAPGTYTGSLKMYACNDAVCSKNFAGSPTTVPYTVTITRGFKVSTQSVGLTALSGSTASADVAVQTQEGQSFTAKSSTDWLKVTNVTASGFTLTTTGMPPGNFFGQVRVDSAGRTKDIAVSYTVTSDQTTVTRIVPSVTSLSFTALTTTATAAKQVDVTLPSWTTELNASLRYGANAANAGGWLTLARTGERSFSLSASAANLPVGSYSADLILASGPMTTPVTVPVSFSVGAASWAVSGARSFAVNQDTTAAQLNAAVTLDLPGVQAQQWTASSNTPWLVLTQATGTTGAAQLKAAVDVAELRKLANFARYTAEVTVSSPNTLIAPLKLSFTLDKAVPELHYASPYARLPGEGGDFTLRGRGLSSMANIGQALQVSGATPQAVTLVSDTELSVKLPGAAGATVSFALPNQLGFASATPEVKLAAPVTYGYQAVPTAGRKATLVFDPVTQSLYTANTTLGSVMRFSYDGSKWNTDSVALPGADMVALAPDGKLLVATSSTSKNVVLLDPATLAVQGSYPAPALGNDGSLLPRLGVMNDGRAYFQGGAWGGLPYFDIYSRSFGELNGNFNFYSGPWFNVSGDGSRMLIVQSGSISPSPPMLYMNSTDTAPKANPAGLQFWYNAAQSLHGERFVEESLRVWDRDFAFIGNLAIPAAGGYYGRVTVLSPDGRRAYVLAYANPGDAPRVYVFDTSTRVVSTTDLPLLGYFTLADSPACNTGDYSNPFSCSPVLRATISPDGKTLFFIGDTKLVVAPVPTLTPGPSSRAATRMRLTVPRS